MAQRFFFLPIRPRQERRFRARQVLGGKPGISRWRTGTGGEESCSTYRLQDKMARPTGSEKMKSALQWVQCYVAHHRRSESVRCACVARAQQRGQGSVVNGDVDREGDGSSGTCWGCRLGAGASSEIKRRMKGGIELGSPHDTNNSLANSSHLSGLHSVSVIAHAARIYPPAAVGPDDNDKTNTTGQGCVAAP